ncbi:CapA family protein [Clostridium sp. HMP27]|nr:CapA family protein [Clostridium sp. HMP27]
MKSSHKKGVFIGFLIIGLLIMSGIISYILYYSVTNEKTAVKPTETRKPQNTSKEENNKPKDNEPKQDVKTNVLLSFAGDSTIGHDANFGFANSLPAVLQKNGNDYSYFFKNVLPIFKNDDLSVVNLETTFTNSNSRKAKQFNFKADPEYAKSLTLGSVEAVNISNNHIYDYNKEGFNDTVNTLKSNDVGFFGEGYKYTKDINGGKFGFLGYTGFYADETFFKKLKSDIQSFKDEGRIVIINFHWGAENMYYPVESQTLIAHTAIDNGADLIIGHHPHVVQGIEQYKGKIIAYSLGNFCFGGNFNPKDKDTFILQVKYNLINGSPQSYEVKAIPCSISSVNYINDYCPTPAQGSEKTRILNKLNNISQSFGFSISDEFKIIK